MNQADIIEEEKQRKEFQVILLKLAKSQVEIQKSAYRSNIYQRLEQLYYAPKKEDRYRHFYSDIFSVLTQIQQDETLGSIDVLGQNLFEIRKGYQPKNVDSAGNAIDISENIKKLYDHVSLDIARLSYSDAMNWKVSGEEAIEELRTQINGINSEVINANSVQKEIEASQKEIEASIKSQQKEYITILGIFAAIILAFVGGITFSSSVLQNMADVSIYRLLLVVNILGFVLTNTIYLLMKFIFVINERDLDMFKIKPLNIAFTAVGVIVIAIAWITLGCDFLYLI